ncbi:MAG: HAD family phosphatase [Geminicoccaceae bacterium]|nr:MAG: HAD family phosphatase [Geminicoccaceae bacterium]
MSLPDVVLFDLGGVLIDWDPRYLYRKLVADEAVIEWFLSEVCSVEWNAAQDAGRLWADAVAEATARHPEQAALIEAYAARWPEMIQGQIDESVAVLEALAARQVPLYALTNWSAETFHHARARFGWLRHFQDILVSGEVRLKKPDPAIFRLMLDRMGVEPATVLFIDDSAANVATSAALGFQTIHFTSPAMLTGDARIRRLLGAPRASAA